ncbi:MAG: DUF302 domain-containing protein [Cyanobacteria bacterium P01_A01_bin.135]
MKRLPPILIAIAIACLSLLPGWLAPSSAALPDEEAGLVYMPSQFSVAETGDRIEALLEERPLNLFTRIDHAENAASVGKDLAPTQVLIFGNPNAGTPLMQCSRTVAIDLPQKMLVWQDEDGQAWLAYNNPSYLMERHNLTGCESNIEMIGKALHSLAIEAAGG